jgi:uncharacterized protein (TIGR00106 family)
MKVLMDLTIVPLGVGLSVSAYIAECERILNEAGLITQLHANGTNIEGDWDAIFAAIKQCHVRLHDMGVPRLHTEIRFGTRTDREQTLAEKVNSVQSKLESAAADAPSVDPVS